jgi:hypothetical protein
MVVTSYGPHDAYEASEYTKIWKRDKCVVLKEAMISYPFPA